VNILLILTCFCLLIFNCSIQSKPDFNRIESDKNNNSRNSKYQNYNPYLTPNYNKNSQPNYPKNNYNSNSQFYQNPYNFPNNYQQKEVYDYDQYYIAPTQYNNIEPERKSVINSKY